MRFRVKINDNLYDLECDALRSEQDLLKALRLIATKNGGKFITGLIDREVLEGEE